MCVYIASARVRRVIIRIRLHAVLCVLLILSSAAVPNDSYRDFNRCLNEVERKTGIDRDVFIAIKVVESGFALTSEATSSNTNGTEDLGIMQINSIWLKELKSYGISRQHLFDVCTNLKIAAWILVRHLQASGDLWEAVGRYHSKTPSIKRRYRQKVAATYKRIKLFKK